MTQQSLGMWGQELMGRDTNMFWHKLTVNKFSCKLGCPSADAHHSLAFLKEAVGSLSGEA